MTPVDALQIVSEPRRREILRLVWDGELSAGEIADRFDVTFGAVSQHLAVLRNAGFVQTRRDGNRRFYVADRARLGPLAQALEAMWSDTLDRLASAVETDVATDAANQRSHR
jgi:DNA-binding transcriptional ArsR family regulator